jgi:heavy metal sensor kinase
MVTLRGRLALINVAVLLMALLLLAGVVLNQVVNDLYERLDRDLETIAHDQLRHVEVVGGVPVFAPNGGQLRTGLSPAGFVRLLDDQGRIVNGFGDYSSAPVVQGSLVNNLNGSVLNQTNDSGLPIRVYTLPLIANNRLVGYIQVANDREEVQETINQVRRSLIIGTPLVLLISGLISLLAARQALSPLTQMTRSAAAISAEALAERLPVPKAKDEVQALAIAFNETLDRLEAAFRRQRRFTADASHELRTPVTAILGHAELALSRPRSPEAYRHSLSLIQSEAERMQRLIGRMLTLARLEVGRHTLSYAPTDVVYLTRTVLDTFQPMAAAKGLTLKFDMPAALTILTDADSLTQILLNLLENAITYTDQGEVALKLVSMSDQVCFEVNDTGRGIPSQHLPHIFQPFYRVDASYSSKHAGVGLGLALTHELVQLLGGTLEVASQVDVGTTFTFTLPAK